jgi:hypothetical protein
MFELPADTAVTSPVLDTVATDVLLETQGLLALGIPDPLNWLVAFTQSTLLPEMLGLGLTVIVNVDGVPGQPPKAIGVTTTVIVIGAFVLLIATKLGIVFPVPEVNPILGPLVFHEKVVLPQFGMSCMGFEAIPLHNTKLGRGLTYGIGDTIMFVCVVL